MHQLQSTKCFLSESSVVADKNWLAERRLALELLEQLETFLAENNCKFEDIKGLVIFRGLVVLLAKLA